MRAKAAENLGAPSGGLVCGCLVSCPLEKFSGWLNHPEADLLEWRIDKFACGRSPAELEAYCEALSAKPRLPVIATNRPVRQMGDWVGPEDVRLGMLEKAARCGAEWVDLEDDTSPGDVARLKKAGARVLLSWHDPAGTPPAKILEAKLEAMSKTGADALKIATFARSPEDNLRVLDLIAFSRKAFELDLVAFCMGEAGKWSRLASVFIGSPWTYAQLPGQSATAPGQFFAAELRELIRALM